MEHHLRRHQRLCNLFLWHERRVSQNQVKNILSWNEVGHTPIGCLVNRNLKIHPISYIFNWFNKHLCFGTFNAITNINLKCGKLLERKIKVRLVVFVISVSGNGKDHVVQGFINIFIKWDESRINKSYLHFLRLLRDADSPIFY